MTRDEIRAEAFSTIPRALNEVFPNIQSEPSGDIMTFDNGAVKIEMSSNDFYDGYFDITNDSSNIGAFWGTKSVISVLIREICRNRKQES